MDPRTDAADKLIVRATTSLRYFWWPEFQKRGALHYHAVLVDPPFEYERDARHWFDSHWVDADGAPLAQIQTWIEYRSFAWFKLKGGDYVLKDVRKLSGKVYEQDYTRMPKGWRTCSSSRLEYETSEHLEHETKAYTVCTAKPEANFSARQLETWVYRVDVHVPARCGCRLTRRRHNGSGRNVTRTHVVRPDHVATAVWRPSPSGGQATPRD